MKFLSSLTAKLLTLMIGTLLAALLCVFFISRYQLRQIIDQSQLSIYQERLEIIIEELSRSNDRLKMTGLYDIYSEDFQKKALEDISQTYYRQDDNPRIYPFILDWRLNVILHPTLPRNDSSLADYEEFYRLKYKNLSELTASYRGEKKWYVFEHFDPWNWIVVYTVPMKEKYGELRSFEQTLILIILLISLILLPFLTIISLNLTKPIVRLTEAARQISEGDLDQRIPVSGRDEVGVLSRSFSQMQHAIKQKIDDLNSEMREREKMEEQLLQARKMDAIGQLAGGVAHDFNNMLAGISSAAQLIGMDETLTHENRKYIRMIQETTERAADLTGKLLAFGRKQHISETVLDIHRIIDDSLYLLERTLDRRIRISIEKKAEKNFLTGDASALQNSIMNLAINAAHAMPDGGELTLTTRNTELDENYCRYSPYEIEPGRYIEITLRDTGT
ncbi:MAG: HAMP domain-containing protein, partial [Spirochaetales bacterium]|nr:HAMP domain-containing protein [Spirochaetales bacterium]